MPRYTEHKDRSCRLCGKVAENDSEMCGWDRYADSHGVIRYICAGCVRDILGHPDAVERARLLVGGAV